MLNMTVFAAMPTESVSTTNSAKNGDCLKRRSANRQSCQTFSITLRIWLLMSTIQTSLEQVLPWI